MSEINRIYNLYLRDIYKRTINKDAYKKLKNIRKYENKLKLLETKELLKELLGLLEIKDSEKLEIGSKITIDLSQFINKKYKIKNIKNKFEYEIDIPFFKRTDEGLILYKFNHSGYPNIIVEEEADLNVLLFAIEHIFDEPVKEIVVYDFLSMKRYSLSHDTNVNYFVEIYKILKTIESNLVPRFVNCENCSNCNNFEACRELSAISRVKGDDKICFLQNMEKRE